MLNGASHAPKPKTFARQSKNGFRFAGARCALMAALLLLVPAVARAQLTATNFFWTNISSDVWSNPGNWTNNQADLTGPVTGGSNNYIITFAPAGTFNSVNDLAGSFLLNQLIFGGSTVTLSGNQLEFTANSAGGLPQVFQNSSVSVVINNNLQLDNNTLFGGSGSGQVTLGGSVGGAGGLILNGGYTLAMTNVNTYAGQTIVTKGSLDLQNSGALGSSSSLVISNNSPAMVLLDGGITVSGVTLTNFMNQSIVGGLIATNGLNTWTGPIVLGADNARFAAANSSTLALSGVISAVNPNYGLTIRSDNGGTGVVLINGTANTYSNTTVLVGTLQIGANNALPTGGIVTLGNGSSQGFALFDLAGYNQQIAGLQDPGVNIPRTVTNTSGTLATLTISNLNNYTYAGAINGNLAVVKAGGGTEALTGSNNYTGGTIVNGGILQIGTSNSLGSGLNGILVNVTPGGALDLNGVNLNYAANSLTVTISGMGIGPTTGAVLNSGAGLANQGVKNLVLAGNAAIGQNGGGRFDIYGTFNGSNYTLTKVGNNEVAIQTAAANLPVLNIMGGDIALQNASGLAGATVTIYTNAFMRTYSVNTTLTNAFVMAGGYFQAGTVGDATTLLNLSGPITLAGALSNTFYLATNLIVSGTMSGPGSLEVLGLPSNSNVNSSVLFLQASNNYSGGTILLSNAVVQVQNAFALGSGSIVVSNVAQLQIAATNAVFNNALQLAGDGLPYNAGWNGALVNKASTGTNTWAGAITIGVNSSSDARIQGYGASNSVLIISGGVTSSNNYGLTVQFAVLFTNNAIRIGNGSLNINSGLPVFSTLGASNNQFGSITLGYSGMMIIGSANTWTNTPNLLIGSGGGGDIGELDLNGFSENFGQLYSQGTSYKQDILTNSSSTLVTVSFNQAASTAFSGQIGGAITLVKAGGGILSLNGTNTYSGGTILNGGELSVLSPTNLGFGFGKWTNLTFNGGILGVQAAATITNLNAFNVNWTNFNGGIDPINAATVFTITNAITGGTGAFMVGSVGSQGKVVLTASNAFTSGIVINGATLYVTNDYNMGAPGGLITLGAGALEITNSFTMARPLMITNAGVIVIDGAGSTDVISGVVSSGGYQNGGLTKSGAGTLVLNGGSSNILVVLTNGVNVSGGLLAISNVNINVGNSPATINGANGSNAMLLLGGSASIISVTQTALNIGTTGRGVLVIQNNALLTNKLLVGTSAGSVGAVYQQGGVVANMGASGINSYLGQSAGAYGYYEMDGGALTNAGYTRIGYSGYGILQQYGGRIYQVANNLDFGNIGTGVYYAAGGTLVSAVPLSIGGVASPGNAGRAEFTVAGNAYVTVSNVTYLGTQGTNLPTAAVATNILNLDGGVFETAQITPTNQWAAGILNFNGGTLRAGAGALNSVFLASNAVYVYAGGATIDAGTNNNVVISTILQAPVGNGVSNIVLSSSGSGYIGAPYVQITGGGGSNATAIAQIDSNIFSPTYGQVTNIVVTNPGQGYTGAPTVQLVGGGGSGASVGTVNTMALVSGGLTKTGFGGLSLLATNTYGGRTIVNAGSLIMGGTTFGIGTNTLTMNGPSTSIGTNGGIDQSLLAWLFTNRQAGGRLTAGSTFGAVVLSGVGTVSSNLNFVMNGLNNVFLGGVNAANASNIYNGFATWGDTSLRFGGGSGYLIYTNQIGGATNVIIGPVGGDPLSVVQLGILNVTNNFTGGITINSGTLKLATNSALGSPGGTSPLVVINPGGALDLAGWNLSGISQTVMISGMGIGPNMGAIYNSGASLVNAGVANVQLFGNAAIGYNNGGSGNRMDISGVLNGGGNTLIKVGTNVTWMASGGTITNLPLLVISNGSFGIQSFNTIAGGGSTVIQVWTGGTFAVYTTITLTNALQLWGGALQNNGPSPSGVTIWNGPIALDGAVNYFDLSGGNMFIGGNISGTGSIANINGSQTRSVWLQGTNTYSGNTYITNAIFQFIGLPSLPTNGGAINLASSGIVQFNFTNVQTGLNELNGTNSFGVVALAATNVNDNINLNLVPGGAASNVSLGALSQVAYNGVITPVNGLYKLGGGGGELVLTGTNNLSSAGILTTIGNVILNGYNSFGGGGTNATVVVQSNSTVSIANEAAVGGYGANLVFSGGVLQVRGIALTNFSKLAVNWTNTVAGNGAVTNLGFNGGLDINNNGNTFLITNNIIGVGITNKLGNGVLALSGSNNPTGGLVVNAGIVRELSSNALGVAGSPMVTVRSGAELQIAGGIVTAPVAVTINGGGMFSPFNAGNVTGGDGAFRNVSGVNTNNGAIILGSAARINADAGTLLVQAGNVTNGANLLTIGGYGNTLVSGTISGSAGLTKDGFGTLTLINTNTLTGGVILNNGLFVLDYTQSALSLGNMITNGNSLTLDGGEFLVLGQNAAGVTTQTFAGLIEGVPVGGFGNPQLVVSNGTSGRILVNVGAVTRAVGGDVVDLTLPANGFIVTTNLNSYAGILTNNGAVLTINGTDFVAVTNVLGNLVMTNFTGYSNVVAGDVINNNSGAVVRITSGSGNAITLNSLTTMIYSMSAINADASATIDFNGQRMLMVGTNGVILLAPGSMGLTLGTNSNDGFLSAGQTNSVGGELIFINNSANALTDNAPLTSNGTGTLSVTVNGSGVVNLYGSTNAFNALYVNSGTVNLQNVTFISGATNGGIGNSYNQRGGTVTLAAGSTNTFLGGNTIVDGGTLYVNGLLASSIIGTNAAFNTIVGNAAGSRATLVVGGNLTSSNLLVGNSAGAAGAVIQTGGVVRLTSRTSQVVLGLGQAAGSYGYYRMTAGTLYPAEALFPDTRVAPTLCLTCMAAWWTAFPMAAWAPILVSQPATARSMFMAAPISAACSLATPPTARH